MTRPFVSTLAVATNGDIFVTDTPANKIYKTFGNTVTTFVQDDRLNYPNRIEVLSNGDLLIAS